MKTPRAAIDTVFFDAGGTLLEVEPSVAAVYAHAAAGHGFDVQPGRVDDGFRAAWKRSLERSRARGYRVSDAILRGEWLEIVRETFGAAVPPSRLGPLFEHLHDRFASAEVWRPLPGVPESLSFLRSVGLRLVVVSNWDSRLPRILEGLGVRGDFDSLVLSHEVGFEKPHPALFEEALRRAGSEATRTLHVGDSLERDIRPAQALGLRTLWITPGGRPAPSDAGPTAEGFPPSPAQFWEKLLAAGCGHP